MTELSGERFNILVAIGEAMKNHPNDNACWLAYQAVKESPTYKGNPFSVTDTVMLEALQEYNS